MRTVLISFFCFVVLMCIPFSLQAKQASLEQVKQNVLYLHRTVMEAQPSISAKKFRRVIDSDENFVLLDVRSEAEFEAAHLPGALHVERGRIEWIIPEIIKQSDRKIYVYCQDGRRSGFAAERLLEMGYTNTVHITDGFEGWVSAGYPVYNMHGEFIMSPGGYNKREPRSGTWANKSAFILSEKSLFPQTGRGFLLSSEISGNILLICVESSAELSCTVLPP